MLYLIEFQVKIGPLVLPVQLIQWNQFACCQIQFLNSLVLTEPQYNDSQMQSIHLINPWQILQEITFLECMIDQTHLWPWFHVHTCLVLWVFPYIWIYHTWTWRFVKEHHQTLNIKHYNLLLCSSNTSSSSNSSIALSVANLSHLYIHWHNMAAAFCRSWAWQVCGLFLKGRFLLSSSDTFLPVTGLWKQHMHSDAATNLWLWWPNAHSMCSNYSVCCRHYHEGSRFPGICVNR